MAKNKKNKGQNKQENQGMENKQNNQGMNNQNANNKGGSSKNQSGQYE